MYQPDNLAEGHSDTAQKRDAKAIQDPGSQVQKIALCGPCTLPILNTLVDDGASLPAGYEYPLLAHLACEYHQRGFDVTVVTSTTQVSGTRWWHGENFHIAVTPRRKHYLFMLDGYRREVHAMVNALRQTTPDVVHAQWIYEFADAAIASGLPTLATARDSPWRIALLLKSPYRLLRALYSQWWVLPRIRHLTAVAPYTATELRNLNRYRRPIAVIQNGLRSSLAAESPRAGIETEYEPRYTVVSNWDRRKNVATAIQAFGQLKQRLPKAQLSLIGPGLGPSGPASCFASKCALNDGLVFHGHRPHHDVIRFLRESTDIFLHPATEEACCMTVVEAMAQGVPVIGGEASGGVPWQLDNGQCGLLCDVRSSTSMADAMYRLATDRCEYAMLASAAWQRATHDFSMAHVADLYLEAYQLVLSQQSLPASL